MTVTGDEPDRGETRTRAGDLDESELVARAARGERDAQHVLLSTHMHRVRRQVLRLVGQRNDVDDLVQTTCVETLRSLPRFRGEASFGLWMERIAANVVYKYFRSNKRRRRRLEPVQDVDVGPDPVDERQRLEWRQAGRLGRELLDELNPERRIMFLLVAVDGRTLEEAAAMLDVSLSAAKSRYLRARRQIDRKLDERPELGELLGRLPRPGHAPEGGDG